jgi:CRISPR/Cas system-associated endonuclease/helicase Cas3
MLYSALVDADFVCTEAHFENSTPEKLGRDIAPDLQPGPLLDALSRFVAEQSTGPMTPEVRQLRAALRTACSEAASRPIGLFTLTGPTGSGKTLASLEFALRHALRHGHRRIVIVLPYLSLIDQTVSVIRGLLAFAGAPYDDPRYLIEHHSLANGSEAPSPDVNAAIGNEWQEDSRRIQGMLSENWDAPIVVTTTIQFFESLFSNRSSGCRKLHRLAGSVILLDEVQTLPARLAVPTLGALACLTAPPFNASAVLMTATQPAFAHLSPKVAELCGRPWMPDEIVPDPPRLFSQIRRTRFVWPQEGQSTSWRELAEEIDGLDPRQALVVVNLKRHAQTLLQLTPESPGVFHLSTTLCPAHRRSILDQVRSRLIQKEECILISTQCVEAGVDLDFPRLYRALGPLEAIAQAAGRCNRNGGPVPGTVTVFRPEPDSRKQFPDPTYAQAAFVTESLLREHGGTLDPSMPEIFEQYYRLIYNLSTHGGIDPKLQEAMIARDFVEVARLYRLIPDRSVNVLVPWDREQFDSLAHEARNSGIHRGWIQKARAHAVGLFTANAEALQGSLLEPVPLRIYSRGRTMSTDWFLLLDESCYDKKLGLVIPSEMEAVHVL